MVKEETKQEVKENKEVNKEETKTPIKKVDESIESKIDDIPLVDKVKVEYEGRLEDGTVFDSSAKHGKPLEFELGKGQVIKGFEAAISKLKSGEETEVTLKPAEAYGELREDLVKEVPRTQLPPGPELKVGMMLMVGLPNGAQIPAKIAEVKPETVKIDLNHPLAGKTLIFKLKLL